MYLRTIRRRNKDGSEVGYVQLAHNVWDPGKRQSRAQVIHSFGREDRLDREALARLVRSITRFLDPEQALAAQAPEGLRFRESRPMGGAWVLDQLWRGLGVGDALRRVAARRRVTPLVERLLFALVCNRALDPMSKLAALEWAQKDVWLPGVGELGSDPQVFYRAMDFLLDCDEEVQREVFFAVANLLNLQVDLLLFDTTSTYFEIPAEREDELRRFGKSKDHRDDLPQVVVGMAVTKEGIPVRCFVFPGNASDQEIIRQVKDALREWRLHRVIWVCDTGFASEQNRGYLQRAGGHYILGEKLRQGTPNREALARPGRYQVVDEGLEVKSGRRALLDGRRTMWMRFSMGLAGPANLLAAHHWLYDTASRPTAAPNEKIGLAWNVNTSTGTSCVWKGGDGQGLPLVHAVCEEPEARRLPSLQQRSGYEQVHDRQGAAEHAARDARRGSPTC